MTTTPTADICKDCRRRLANKLDEAFCNTGECGCEVARSICWRRWNNDVCAPFSPYDLEPKP